MDKKAPVNNPSIIVADFEQLTKVFREIFDSVITDRVPDIIKKANEKDYLTSADVRTMLGCSVRSLQYMRDTRQLPFVKHGRKIVYPRAGVEKFIQVHHILPRENKKGV